MNFREKQIRNWLHRLTLHCASIHSDQCNRKLLYQINATLNKLTFLVSGQIEQVRVAIAARFVTSSRRIARRHRIRCTYKLIYWLWFVVIWIVSIPNSFPFFFSQTFLSAANASGFAASLVNQRIPVHIYYLLLSLLLFCKVKLLFEWGKKDFRKCNMASRTVCSTSVGK